MTFGQADDLVYEFASYSIDAPGRSPQHWPEVCVSTLLMRSLRVGQCVLVCAPCRYTVSSEGHLVNFRSTIRSTNSFFLCVLQVLRQSSRTCKLFHTVEVTGSNPVAPTI